MLWKIYFWLMLLGTSLFGVMELTALRLNTSILIADIVIAVLGIAALYGYTYKRKFLIPVFWKIFFPVQLIWDFGFHAYMSFTQSQYPAGIYFIANLILAMPLIPFYIGVYKYAFVDSKYTQTQLTFRQQMKKVKKSDSPYEISRNGNPFLKQ